MKIYAIGVVTQTVVPGDLTIKVYPHSLFPNVKVDDLSKVKGMECYWARGDSSSVLTPQFQIGETVEILNYEDSDFYFCRSISFEPMLRGVERQIYTWSTIDRNKEPNARVDGKNSVWFKVDNVNHLVHLHTPSNTASLSGVVNDIDIIINYGTNVITINNGLSKIKLDKKELTFDVDTVVFNGKSFTVNHDKIELNADKTDIPKGKFTVGANSEFMKHANFVMGSTQNMKASVVAHSAVK